MRCSCDPDALENNRLARRIIRCRNTLWWWFWGGDLDAYGDRRHGMVLPVLTILIFLFLMSMMGVLLRWHHQDITLREIAYDMPRIGFNTQGFPETPIVHSVLVVDVGSLSGGELVKEWLSGQQPSLPYVRYNVKVVGEDDPRDVVCQDHIRNTILSLPPNTHILMVFREPVATLAHWVRMEHTSKGPLAEGRRNVLRTLVHQTHIQQQVSTEGFTERIIHQMTRQIHMIRQCDHAYGVENMPTDIVERFSRCYTYSLCHSEKEYVSTATEDHGIMMGMYDCIYQLWKDNSNNNSMGIITLEEILSHGARPDFEQDLLVQLGIQNVKEHLVYRGKMLNVMHQTDSMDKFHGKQDLEYLPRKLRQRLYAMYHFHMERAARLMGRNLYVYQTHRYSGNTRGQGAHPEIKPIVSTLSVS